MKKTIVIGLLALFVLLPLMVQAQIRLQHGPYLQNLKQDEVTLVWVASKPSIGWVELAPDDGSHFYAVERRKYFDTRSGVKRTDSVHSVRLTGLKPGTRYRYRVFSQEVLSHNAYKIVYGDVAATVVYKKEPPSFITPDPNKKDISFAVVNDIHARNEVLEKLISLCDKKKTDLFVFNGDMVSISNSQKELFDGFMDKAVTLFASEKPMYYTRGNHETRGRFATSFQNYFSPKEPHLYYTFRQGPVFFVMLDTGEDKPDSDIEYAGITDYDAYRTEQAEWLKKVINSSEYKDAPFKVIIGHIPPFRGWHGDTEVATKFIPILNSDKPDLMLCGHLHQSVYCEPDQKRLFPLIVNSNNSVLTVNADSDKMEVIVTNVDGKAFGKWIFKRMHP